MNYSIMGIPILDPLRMELKMVMERTIGLVIIRFIRESGTGDSLMVPVFISVEISRISIKECFRMD